MEHTFSHVRTFAQTILPSPSPSVVRACCIAVLVGASAGAWAAPDTVPKAAVTKVAPQKTGGVININTADANALAELNGVGPSKAAAIIEHRKQHGPFKSVEQLADVKGIGDALIAKNRDRISVR